MEKLLTLFTRERIWHIQSEKWWQRWLLLPTLQEKASRTHDARLQQPKIQTQKGLQQQPYSKPHGQETSHSHAAGDRGAVLPLLDTDLVVNAWRAFDRRSADRLFSGAPISFIHLLSYTSACVNPIVYCFMNKRFRQGVLATFSCCRDDMDEVSRSSTRHSARGAGALGTLFGGSGGTRQAHGNTQSSGTLTRLTNTSIRGSAQA